VTTYDFENWTVFKWLEIKLQSLNEYALRSIKMCTFIFTITLAIMDQFLPRDAMHIVM